MLAVKVDEMLGDWFAAEIGTRQGDLIVPLSFIFALLERIMEAAQYCATTKGDYVHGAVITDLQFADDVDQLAETEAYLQSLVSQLHTISKDYGLKINKSKSSHGPRESQSNDHSGW